MSLLRNVLLVYLIFEFIVTAHRWLLGAKFNFDPTKPSFALWFLLALFFWRLLLPYLSKVRWIIPISFVVAVGAGFFSNIGPEFTLSRMLCYLPVFLIGWKLSQMGLHETLNKRSVRIGAVAVIAAWAVAMFIFKDHFMGGWFSMRSSYPDGYRMLSAMARGLLLVGGAATTVSFLALVPRRRIPWMTYLGTGSLYIYLLHPFALRHANHLNLLERVDKPYEVIGLIQPRYTWLFTPDLGGKVKDERSQTTASN